MRRREFITLVGGAAAMWPLAARAEQVRRVGVLDPRGDEEMQSNYAALRAGLEELGWVPGKNLHLDYRTADGSAERLSARAAESVALKPDVIVVGATPGVAALQRVTQTVPIVFINANNPIGSGFVASLARPGGNITGFLAFEPSLGGKWIEILKEVAPSIGRIALLHNPRTHTGQYFQSSESAMRALSLQAVPAAFGNAAQIERVVGEFARASNGGLLVLPDSSTSRHRELIVSLAASHRLPAIYPYRRFLESGGLISYGVDQSSLYRQAASYVDRILKGEKPADLPVQAPTRYHLGLNLKTAKTLGLDVPAFLQQRADEVIE